MQKRCLLRIKGTERQYNMKRRHWTCEVLLAGSRLIKLLSCKHQQFFFFFNGKGTLSSESRARACRDVMLHSQAAGLSPGIVMCLAEFQNCYGLVAPVSLSLLPFQLKGL